MAGLIELCRVLVAPGEQVAFFTPAYPPFFAELPQARVELVQLPLGADAAVDLEALEAAAAPGADQSAQSDRPSDAAGRA